MYNLTNHIYNTVCKFSINVGLLKLYRVLLNYYLQGHSWVFFLTTRSSHFEKKFFDLDLRSKENEWSI